MVVCQSPMSPMIKIIIGVSFVIFSSSRNKLSLVRKILVCALDWSWWWWLLAGNPRWRAASTRFRQLGRTLIPGCWCADRQPCFVLLCYCCSLKPWFYFVHKPWALCVNALPSNAARRHHTLISSWAALLRILIKMMVTLEDGQHDPGGERSNDTYY